MPDWSSIFDPQRLEPFLEIVSLSPHHLVASLVFLAAFMLSNDLVRTALMVSLPRSAIAHFMVVIMTVLPAIECGIVLVIAAFRYPDRIFIDIGLVVLLFGAWYVGGTLTRLARRDTEGADVGFMAAGALITLLCAGVAVPIALL